MSSASHENFPRARRPPPARALSSARRRRSAPLLLALAAAAISAATLYGSGMLASVSQALSRPILNDVSTDLDAPPQFSAAPSASASASASGAPPGPVPLPEEFKGQIRRAYPGLKPLEVAAEDPSKVFAALEKLARARSGWEVTFVDAGASAAAAGGAATLQGVATTPLLRFKDDFVFRVKKSSEKETVVVVVDGRSRSRLGRGDLGANAARIESFFADLKRELDA